jgi:hypothetical protein
LFNPVAREAVPITYDRADQRRFRDVLGECVIRTPIAIQSLVRWSVYSGAASAVSGVGMRVQHGQVEMLFAGILVCL